MGRVYAHRPAIKPRKGELTWILFWHQKQAALNKEKSELATVLAKVEDAQKALRDAEKGREDSVSYISVPASISTSN